MKPRRIQVSHSKADGFVLTVEEYSRTRSLIAGVGDWLCQATGHLGCNRGPFSWMMNQDWDNSTKLVTVPIDRGTADKLSRHKDTWSWLDEE